MGERTILEWNEDKSPYAETRDKCLLVQKRRRYRISKMMNTSLDGSGNSKHGIQATLCVPFTELLFSEKYSVIIIWIDY
ncbi:MAG: hypothetical protein L0H53_09665 [Candidatus Nitrosocosmicus sp.]|nr:hypothetical protein [Candidatus Nitrosocosmicus sp.]MDN5866507.1 hypothetical protein [Candidatus Nitrosocosmicus sp.]